MRFLERFEHLVGPRMLGLTAQAMSFAALVLSVESALTLLGLRPSGRIPELLSPLAMALCTLAVLLVLRIRVRWPDIHALSKPESFPYSFTVPAVAGLLSSLCCSVGVVFLAFFSGLNPPDALLGSSVLLASIIAFLRMISKIRTHAVDRLETAKMWTVRLAIAAAFVLITIGINGYSIAMSARNEIRFKSPVYPYNVVVGMFDKYLKELWLAKQPQRYPAADRWMDALDPYSNNRNVLELFLRLTEGQGLAINDQIAGRKPEEIHRDTVMMFSSAPQRNAAGGPSIASFLPRKLGLFGRAIGEPVCMVYLANGEAVLATRAELGSLRWKP